MSQAVEIPDALRADIEQHPDRYRPKVFEEDAEDVLILATKHAHGGSVGYAGYVTSVLPDEIAVGWSLSGDDPAAPIAQDGSPVIRQRGVTCWEPLDGRSPADAVLDLMDGLAAATEAAERRGA